MRAVGLVVALAVAGCTGSTWLRPHAFVPPLRHYRIRYDDLRARAVLPGGWTVVNHTATDIRRGGDWTVRGRAPDGRTIERPAFDLFAEHDEDRAAIWVQTVPIGRRLGERSLEQLADRIVQSGIPAGLVALGVERQHRRTQVVSSRIVERGPAEVSGVPAHLVTVELVVGASHDDVLFTFVLFRPRELGWRSSGLADAHGEAMLVMAGIEAALDRYDAHRPTFEALLSRLDIRP